MLRETRFNREVRRLILNDVIKSKHIEGLLSNNKLDEKGEDFLVIDKFKIERRELICTIYASLIGVSQVDYIKVLVDHFMIIDFESAVEKLDMIAIMEEMLVNERWLKQDGDSA